MTQTAEYRAAIESVPNAVRESAAILDYTGLTCVAEVADCAHDQLCEYSVYLTPEELADLDAAITRYVLDVFGFDRGASDGSDITMEMLTYVADGKSVPPILR
jgi:hypothetical protein